MFSIIIPLYNKSPYIEKAIQSVAAQSFQDFELIVIDDGSTDDSLANAQHILANLTPPFGGWGVVEQENQGVSTTRNNGVKLARYDYITFLDADDWWEPTFLEEMKTLIAAYPEAGIYGSSYFKVKRNVKIPANIGVPPNFVSGYINYFSTYSKTMWMPLTSISVVIPKTVFSEIGGFNPKLKIGEDFDLWVRLALEYPVAFLNIPLAFYNQDVEQKNRGVVDFKIYTPPTHFIFNLDYLRPLEQKNPDLKKLLDLLRLYALLRYRIEGKYKDDVNRILSYVNFKNKSISQILQYKLPPILIRYYYKIKYQLYIYLKK